MKKSDYIQGLEEDLRELKIRHTKNMLEEARLNATQVEIEAQIGALHTKIALT